MKSNIAYAIWNGIYNRRYKPDRGTCGRCYDDATMWETPEQAFEEYKRFNQSDILMGAANYKNKIPRHVYEALLKYDVKPYVED